MKSGAHEMSSCNVQHEFFFQSFGTVTIKYIRQMMTFVKFTCQQSTDIDAFVIIFPVAIISFCSTSEYRKTSWIFFIWFIEIAFLSNSLITRKKNFCSTLCIIMQFTLFNVTMTLSFIRLRRDWFPPNLIWLPVMSWNHRYSVGILTISELLEIIFVLDCWFTDGLCSWLWTGNYVVGATIFHVWSWWEPSGTAVQSIWYTIQIAIWIKDVHLVP